MGVEGSGPSADLQRPIGGVVRVLRGSAEGSLDLRNIGGTVGDTRIEVEGLEPLERNNLYASRPLPAVSEQKSKQARSIAP
jgi:hypothetical protein